MSQDIRHDNLDRMVAKAVMGQESQQVRVRGTADKFVEVWNHGKLQDGLWDEEDLKGWSKPSPYSTDIAVAWMVHQKICSLSFSKRQSYYRHLKVIASEQLRDETGEERLFVQWPDVLTVLKDKMPVAICLAALRASKVEVSNKTTSKKDNS